MIRVLAVMDDGRQGDLFFGVPVVSITEGLRGVSTPVVISSLKLRDELTQVLHDLGVAGDRIYVAGATE